MKKINKQEPAFFSEFFQKYKPKIWDDIANIREEMRAYMLSGLSNDPNTEEHNEQNYQCAYTEKRIDSDNTSSHIDHFKKRNDFPQQVCEWSNLFAACNSEDYGAKYKDKTKNIDYALLINPAVDEPSEYFEYSFTGAIVPKSQEKSAKDYKRAQYTIDTFNLNARSLVEERKTAIDIYNSSAKESSNLSELKDIIAQFDAMIAYLYATDA